MGAPFSDITLYTPTPYAVGTLEYVEETSLKNFVSDLYVQKMNGYKPTNATRVTLQPAYHNIWNRTWKNGSLFSIAPLFEREKYNALDKKGKYKYILDIIHWSMLQLSEEYKWDREVFEKAYEEVIDKNFSFIVEYTPKKSKDKKKDAKIVIEKSETITRVYSVMNNEGETIKAKLIDKKNWWWYDEAYKMAKHSKWFDNDRFGIHIQSLNFAVWYSLTKNKVLFEVNGAVQEDYNLKRMFTQY